MSTNGSFAARRAAARRGKAAVLAAVAPTEHLPAVAPDVRANAPEPVLPTARRQSNAPDLRSPEQIAAERAAREAQAAAVAAENPDDIPTAPEPDPEPEQAPAPTVQTVPAPDDGQVPEVPETEGVVVLSLAGLRPGTPHVMRVGAGPLPEWCATRPLGVRWASGWWTDAGPLPAKAKAAPEGAVRAEVGLAEQAAGRWRELQGQTVGPWAWVLAIGHMGEVIGAFHVPAHRRARLLAALGAAEAGTPPEDDWSLVAGARFGEPDPVADAPAVTASAPVGAPTSVEDWPIDEWPIEEPVWDEPDPGDLGDEGWAMPVGF
ncbi:hypothetical protein [Cellulosimicrobium sp. Marseille-Q4280]|uniref:hypothetical protein n=1 Tax=Cellulosimicrobium sp. Marseille-Q4280 TaxID=2937992 RepID=UPI00203E3717|nr:hypothetical protein [Cellulosimicrobium sp. Marseille-Q4280]